MRGKIPKNDLNAFILARNQTGTGLIDAESGWDIHALQQLRQAKSAIERVSAVCPG